MKKIFIIIFIILMIILSYKLWEKSAQNNTNGTHILNNIDQTKLKFEKEVERKQKDEFNKLDKVFMYYSNNCTQIQCQNTLISKIYNENFLKNRTQTWQITTNIIPRYFEFEKNKLDFLKSKKLIKNDWADAILEVDTSHYSKLKDDIKKTFIKVDDKFYLNLKLILNQNK